MNFLTLDFRGILLAFVFGFVFLFFGIGFGLFFVGTMILFLLLSAIVTYIGRSYKRGAGLGQEPRSIKNVVANGAPPLVFAVIFYIFSISGYGGLAMLAVIGFLAAASAITADKFSSEIGVLNGRPKMAFTLRKVKKGTSGAITLLGTFAGLAGAFIVALLVILVAGRLTAINGHYLFSLKKAILTVTFGGFMGSFVDTLLGYYEEKGMGNKFTTNFVCGITGGIIAMAAFAVF